MFSARHRGGSGPPLVLIHGFTDSWRTWELVLDELERHHDVLAPTLPGHAGGPPIDAPLHGDTMVDAVEAAMDDAGLETAHLVGNSLGGYVAMQLAARGRARSLVAFAPAGGWAPGDDSFRETLAHFTEMRPLVEQSAPHADAIMASSEGRRGATQFTTVAFEHIPPELLAHQLRAAAACDVALELIDFGLREGWPLQLERIDCPVRVVWGVEDRLLLWPSAAAGYRAGLPTADWVELDGVGHCPQLDVPREAAQLILGWTSA